MRFLYKRPKMEDVSEELKLLMDLMNAKSFVIMDIIWLSLIFTLLLAPVLATVTFSIVFFGFSFVLFTSIYFVFFYPFIKKT